MNKSKVFVVSDIHLKKENQAELSLKIEKLVTHINILSNSDDIILFSGDLAYSGKSEEYDVLYELLHPLTEKLKIFLCPGNHDVNFSQPQEIRDIVIGSLGTQSPSPEIVEQLTSCQKEYFEFSQKLCGTPDKEENKLAQVYYVNTVDKNIQIISLNTAWVSKLKEKSGTLFFPTDYLPKSSSDHFSIAFCHHPLSWLEANNQKQVRNYLRKELDLVITGHEHIKDSFKVSSSTGESIFVESISFDDPHMDENGFLAIELEDTLKVKTFIWKENDFFEKSEKIEYSAQINNIISSTNEFQLKINFIEQLSELGAGFTHKFKETLKINDVFIYPNLKLDGNTKTELTKFSAERVVTDTIHNKLILVGEETSGKTTLLNKLFLEFYSDGKLPVLINGHKAKKIKRLKVDQLSTYLAEQYKNLTTPSYLGDAREKILLIDNFDKIKGSKTEKNTILSELFKHFEKIVLTVSESYDITGLQVTNSEFLNGFQKADILRFGHRLRYELINKWNELKDPCKEERHELICSNDKATKTINRLLGKNFIPSTPLFLLTMLQSMDTGETANVNTSSHGYYYQYLITTSMGNAGIKKEELEEIYNYIQELAYYFYIRDNTSEDFNSLWDFNNKFCKEYELQTDLEKRLALLVKANLIRKVEDSNSYTFKYQYIYYFFIAKHLADNLDESEIKDIINGLVDKIHISKNMNIVMFLTHHSKDKSLLEKIIAHGKNQFKDHEKASLDLDVLFLDDLVDSLPQLDFIQTESDSHNYRLLKADEQDVQAETIVDDEPEESLQEGSNTEEENMTSIIDELNLTFKSLELMGQLARAYYGSLKADKKYALLEEAISAPLRAMGSLLDSISSEPDEIIKLIEKKVNEKIGNDVNINQSEINDAARKVLFDTLWLIGMSFVRKIASSIGNENLISIIEKIALKENKNSYYLILLATRLDLGNQTSLDSIKQTINKIKPNALATLVSQGLVLDYLYMFDIKDEVTRKLCSLTKINYQHVSKQIYLENSKLNKLIETKCVKTE